MLLRLEARAGHGAGKPLNKVLDELTDTWTFVFSELGVEVSERWEDTITQEPVPMAYSPPLARQHVEPATAGSPSCGSSSDSTS